jgi:hypothetical protein
MKLFDDWQDTEDDLIIQIDDEPQRKTGEKISIKDFKKRFPDYKINIAQVCEPPQFQIASDVVDGVSYWLRIYVDRLGEDMY